MWFSQNDLVQDFIKACIGAVIGFSLFWVTSHPRSPIRKKLPRKKIKNVYVLPNIQITYKNTVFHLHHWINMSTIYAATLVSNRKVTDYAFYHGFMFGSIMQGLIFPDRLKFRKIFDKQ